MIVSVNWLKKFVDFDLPIDELTTLIGARLVEIEKVVDLTPKYKDVLIVRVVECAPLEGTDHLNLTKIDDGGVVEGVERDDKGLVQVVCGAPNVHADMLAAWLPPTSTVPESYNDSEPFVLTAKNLRGTVSNGMLASAKELDLFDDHTGILEIDKEVPAGSSLATVYGLDDYLLDIENKSLTHRPDTFGIIGFAREVAAILGKTFVTPEWLANTEPTYGDKNGDIATPKITIEDPSLSAKYLSVVLSGASADRHSPLEIQTLLSRVGVRPINAVVDVTNYLMMLTGQPLHAFDYDKLVALSGGEADIRVRVGKDKELLELLDGRTVELTPDDIVIAAGETAIGLAGAMGGANTVIDKDTKNIIIESATFNLYKLRSTQMRHGIFSEAITRFTKGQPADLAAPVLADAVELIEQWAGAKRVSDVAVSVSESPAPVNLNISAEFINAVLGTSYSLKDIRSTLESVEFAVVEKSATELFVAPPYWRADIHIPEDIVEEIGRIKGFDEIAPTLATRDFTAVRPSGFDELRQQVRRLLVRAGANEVLTYSFVHGDLMKKAGQSVEGSYQIINSISPDLQYYRQSLTPSLLNVVNSNAKQGYEQFALFELNKTHQKIRGLDEEQVPIEDTLLALTITSRKTKKTAAYYDAKKYLDYVADMLGLELEYSAMETAPGYSISAPFEYRRSAMVKEKNSGVYLGIVGEYTNTTSRAFKLPVSSAGFEIDAHGLYEATLKTGHTYSPLSRFPGTSRDICFQVNKNISYDSIMSAAKTAIKNTELLVDVTPLDIYQDATLETKNVTIRVQLTSYQKTLASSDVDETIAVIVGVVTEKTHATVL
jgi:phenylalanyl-tRNA synthetase beta chain